MALLGGIALAYAINAMSLHDRVMAGTGPDQPPIAKTVGGAVLDIPANWFRYDDQKTEGYADRVDLSLTFPLGAGGADTVVDVTLSPKSRVRPSALLLDSVYLHMFQASQVEGPPGLVGKPLANKEGYQSETVWYDPLSVNPFVAKCQAPLAAGEQGRCLRTVVLDDKISATYAFDRSVLASWKIFDDTVSARLEPIIEP